MNSISKADLVDASGNIGKSRVRFQFLFGPASVHPHRMGWPHLGSQHIDNWYGWRLIGANNRELGRSAMSFGSYPLARRAVALLQRRSDQLVRHTVVDPTTGRWSWRLDFDNVPVAVSGRWYERDHGSRLGVDTFLKMIPEAMLADGIVTLRDRRGPILSRTATEGAP